MAVNRLEPIKPADEAQRPPEKKEGTPVSLKSGGSGKIWVPVIANIVLMPVIAYALTTFVLIPKIQDKGEASAATDNHSASGGSNTAKAKFTVPLSGKVLVNVAGTAGTRYLVASITLVGKHPSFKQSVELNDPQLRDAAASILGGKTISDLEKPGTRNMVRAELIAAFNDILGKEAVTDIYLTEFAIQ